MKLKEHWPLGIVTSDFCIKFDFIKSDNCHKNIHPNRYRKMLYLYFFYFEWWILYVEHNPIA